MSTWVTGVAEVIGTSPRGVIVKCPHCGDTHAHARSMVGSNHVVAALLDSLIAQRNLCGGDKCSRRKCKRCTRFRDWQARQVKS